MLQAILNVIDFGMSMQEAVSVERIHSEDEKRKIIVELAFPDDLAAQLGAMGQHRRTRALFRPAVRDLAESKNRSLGKGAPIHAEAAAW